MLMFDSMFLCHSFIGQIIDPEKSVCLLNFLELYVNELGLILYAWISIHVKMFCHFSTLLTFLTVVMISYHILVTKLLLSMSKQQTIMRFFFLRTRLIQLQVMPGWRDFRKL